ncbi:chromatin assembly factor 1 subunit A isoform X1 [Anguilla rostrata]|uniref:chromatin assembly factor 1 subunit A isoform X1 n=2 Tax=Anguilla rostrata TaxID=7938 RepID=UPI0030D4472D
MLAAEDPSSERHVLASTPRRRGMDCKAKSSAAAKKLIQARLPFKRLNPEPKENGAPKRVRGPPTAPPNLDPSSSDGENELDPAPPLLPPNKATLVNGRGPLDGFVKQEARPRRSAPPAPSATIDLTEDSNSAEPAGAALPAPTRGSQTGPAADAEPAVEAAADAVSLETEGGAEARADNEDADAPGSPSVSAETPPPDPPREDAEENETDVSTNENVSLLSPSSASSLSATESSPEPAKSAMTSPASTTPKTNENTEGKKVKRRSLKNTEEERRRQEEREERERQRQEAREAKERKKEEARKLKEEREKERKEKKEREEKERAEKLRAKEEQRRVKQDAKLEEKKKKEEEKRVKEEEKRVKEEKDRIKAEKAEITRFLQRPKSQQAPKTLAAACGKFAPFEIKEHMLLAPLVRVQCEEAALEELDSYLSRPDGTLDGLRDWRRHRPRRSGPTRACSAERGGDCMVVPEGQKPEGVPGRQRYGRMKLLQFQENYRPAYWGTWNKKSAHISPRCPLRQDKVLLDYEVESDEEWVEEEPGESLSHSEGDDDDEGGEDDDDDDGFFVPHGYLSDGEGALEEEEKGDVEKQKVRQRLKAREWDELMAKKKFKVLEAVVRGCVWVGPEGAGPEAEALLPFAVCLLEAAALAEEPVSPETTAAARERRDELLLSQLLSLLHGNVNSSKVIITEFQEFCRQKQACTSTSTSPQRAAESIPARIHVKRLITKHAVYEKRPAHRRSCWYAHADVLSRFGQEALPVPCQWKYLTQGPHEAPEEPAAAAATPSSSSSSSAAAAAASSSSAKRKSTGSMSITKFLRKCRDTEQGEAMETDGFQADTEEDEDENDCIIVNTQAGSSEEQGKPPVTTVTAQTQSTEHMEVTTSDLATASLPCPAHAAVPETCV